LFSCIILCLFGIFADMIKENLHQPFECELRELDKFPKVARQNNFFELVYVLDGNGRQFVGGNEFYYKPGNLFLLTPQDVYSFEITRKTQFFFIRFNDFFISTPKAKSYDDGDWLNRMKFILENASHQPGCILKNQTDKPVVRDLIESIIREQTNQQLFHNKIIRQIVNTVITIVARNISLRLPEKIKANSEESVLKILHYIHQNIYESEKLKAERMSKELGISSSYLGRYFKKHTNETMQEYIINYKLKLVETRLLHSDMRINEIAYELNFTDESHLHRIFKKYRGMNPSEFKKNKL
jgi:AraC-like DNA-binding protein